MSPQTDLPGTVLPGTVRNGRAGAGSLGLLLLLLFSDVSAQAPNTAAPAPLAFDSQVAPATKGLVEWIVPGTMGAQSELLERWCQQLGDSDFGRREQAFDSIVRSVLLQPEHESTLRSLSRRDQSDVSWCALMAMREVELRRSMQVPESFALSTTAGGRRATILSVRIQRDEGQSDTTAQSAQTQATLASVEVQLEGILQACEEQAALDPASRLLGVLPLHWTLDSMEPVREITLELDGLRAQLHSHLGGLKDWGSTALARELGALALPGVPQSIRVSGNVQSAELSEHAVKLGAAVAELEASRALLIRCHPVDLTQLGVYVVTDGPSSGTIKRLGLMGGQGVEINGTVPGSLSHHLHVAGGSVLMELNGRVLKTGADITEALAGRRPFEAISLTWYDPCGTLLRHRWTQADAGSSGR